MVFYFENTEKNVNMKEEDEEHYRNDNVDLSSL